MTQLLSFTGTCEARLDSANSGNTILLLSVSQILSPYEGLKDDYYIAVDFRLESLRGEISLLESLEKAPFPNFYPEDSVAKKLEKKFEVDQRYPSMGLEILKRSSSGNLIRLSEIWLQNKGAAIHAELRIPYLGTGPVKLFGETDELFLRLNDKGYGLISSSNDYLQIEGDFSVTVSGIKRKIDAPNPIDLELLWEKGILRVSGGILESLPTAYPNINALRETIKRDKFAALGFRQSQIFSLEYLGEVANSIEYLDITRCYHLKTTTLNQEIFSFTSLRELRMDSVDRSGLDFESLVTVLPITVLYASRCNLTDVEIETILTSLVSTGRTNGQLRLQQNASLTTNAVAARNDLMASGWVVYV